MRKALVVLIVFFAFSVAAATLTLRPSSAVDLPPSSAVVFTWDSKTFGVLDTAKRVVTLYGLSGQQTGTISLGKSFQPLPSPTVFPHVVFRDNGLYWITNRGEIARYLENGDVDMMLDLKASTFWAAPRPDGNFDVLAYDVANQRYDRRTYTPKGILKAAVPIPTASDVVPDIDRAFFFHVPLEARVPVHDTTVTIGNRRVDYLQCPGYPANLRQIALNAIASTAQAQRTPEPIAVAAAMATNGDLNIITNGGALVHIDKTGATSCTSVPSISASTFITTSVAQASTRLATITQVGPKASKHALLRFWTLDVEK